MAPVIIAASSKPLVVSPTSTARRRPKPFRLPQILKKPLPTLKHISVSLAGAGAASLALSRPVLAAEMEKAALFDFNLTLPIIMAEFLLLMVALDKIYFSPLGKVMDDRDAAVREKLQSVREMSEEVKRLEEQADAVMRAARAEAAAATAKRVKETEAEIEMKLAEESAKLEAELREALVKLEEQKEETLRALDSQIALLSEEIIDKVISV